METDDCGLAHFHDSRPEVALCVRLQEVFRPGIDFEPQFPFNTVNNYSLDFVLYDGGYRPILDVEVDGPHHIHRRRFDKMRDTFARKRGMQVLRYDAELVRQHPDWVTADVYSHLESIR